MEHPQPVIDDIVRASAAHACQTRIFRHLPKIEPFRMFFKNYRIKAFAKWMRANKPDVLIEFSKWQSHAVRAKFAHETALVSLHAVPAEGGCGILYDIDVCAKEAVNLLHFCRNTYQWGLPDWRIDHVVEPKWVEGDSLPVVRTASTSGDFEDPFAVDWWLTATDSGSRINPDEESISLQAPAGSISVKLKVSTEEASFANLVQASSFRDVYLTIATAAKNMDMKWMPIKGGFKKLEKCGW
jgi:hypothetical protein